MEREVGGGIGMGKTCKLKDIKKKKKKKNLPAMQETQILSLGLEDPLEKDMVTHSTLAWRIPWRLVGYSPWGCKELDMTE